MKRTERRHLKDNELERFALQARDLMDAKKREMTMVIVAVVVVGAAAIGYFVWRDRVNTHAAAMLADATTVEDARVGPAAAPGTPNPGVSFATEHERSQAALTKFKAAADAYPSTDDGVFARLKQASTEMTLQNPQGAALAYQQVIDRAGTSVYGQMARLGLAEAQARSGQYDQAIKAFVDLSQKKEGPLPVDGILMHLGRTYLDAGKRTEAQQTFNRLVQEYPESPFTGDARKALDDLKKT
jgi:predicted negative regulator of RcsB-dependent stress response